MGIFAKKSSAPTAQTTQPINNVRVNESVRGKLIPVSPGTNRLPIWLLWNDDFQAIQHTTKQHVGGGLFGSGGGDTTETTTTYQTAFQAGLAYGQINHVANVWNGSGKVQAVQFTENFTVPPGGGIFTPNPPGGGGFVGIRAVGFSQAYSQTLTDFGASSSTVLSGSFIQPMLQGTVASTGVYTVNTTTGATTFAAGDAGKSVQINYTANFTVITSTEEDVIPSGGTIQVPNSTLYQSDGGVNLINPTTFVQTPMVRVTGTPATGQYTVSTTGLYTFAAADHFKLVQITWNQSDPNATGAAATLNFSLINGVEGQSPWSYLTGAHPDAAIGYSGIATVQSQALQLGSGAEMPQLSFECVGSYLAGGSIIDCNPSDVLYAYLTDHLFGIDFPTANIEWNLTIANLQTGGTYAFVPAINSPGLNATSFWAANNYFISPLVDNQTTVSQEFADILEAGQCAVIWSEGLLKLRPYGDTSAAANGFIYQPLTQPVFDLGIDDFIAGPGDEAIQISRSAWNGTYNIVQIQYEDRANGYESEVIQEEDLASVQALGVCREDPQDWEFIKTSQTAQWVANMRVKRLSNIRNSYEFTIPAVYDVLEPMDLVTLTHPGYGFNKLPVRITKIEDDPEKGLTITAEDFPYGIAKATLYPKQTNLADNTSPAMQEPGNAEPVILELPDQFTQFTGYTMRIYAVPDNPENWGGCEVYLSGDNVEFDTQGSITTPALSGTLSGSMAAGTGDPDTGTTITVVCNNNLQLLPASTFDFNNHSESCLLCIVDAAGTFEIVAYQNAVLTGVNTYQVSTFHRGLFGTTRASHASGCKVLAMGQGHLELQYPPSQVGSTNWVKLTSFNTVGARIQDVNIVASNSFPLTGAFPGLFDKTTGQLFHSTTLNNQGSVLPNQGVLINYAFPSTSLLITTWGTQSLLRPDGSSLTVNASSGTNLLINGDMESGTVGSQETGWTNIGGFGLITVSTNVHSGTKAGNINNTSGTTSQSWSGNINLTAGQAYALEGWIQTDALPNVPTQLGGMLALNIVSGITSYTILTKFGAFDGGNTTLPNIGLPANGTAHAYTFVQCYFIPAASGVVKVQAINQSNGGNVWFDDVKLYPYLGAIYTGLAASTTYYLYPYVETATGNLKFANGNPPTTSPSDTFAMNCQLDGRIGMAVIKPTSPASGGGGGGFGGTGGGSGTCPEFNELVDVQRYSQAGELIFTGQIKAGEVRHGQESHKGKIRRGDFLKGHSFRQDADVYRAVQKVMHVPCCGWSIVGGHRVTACEHVYINGQWTPAWKAPGATHDSFIGKKVLIQVKADEDDEHNYYVGDLLIHNSIILPC
jgi:hypothetical protein